MDKRLRKLTMSVTDVGHASQVDGTHWGPGLRELHVLHYVLGGRGFFECMGKRYEVSAGQAFLIVPGAAINYGANLEDPWEYCWFELHGYEATALLKKCALTEKNPVSTQLPRSIGEKILEMFKERKKGTPAGDCAVGGLARLVLAELMEAMPSTEYVPSDSLFKRAVAIMEAGYHRQGMTVESLAKTLGVSRVSLYRCFEAGYGVPPSRYLIDLRMERACRLLEQGDYPIKQVAYSVGIPDSLYFSKLFRLKKGCSPHEWRERYGK